MRDERFFRPSRDWKFHLMQTPQSIAGLLTKRPSRDVIFKALLFVHHPKSIFDDQFVVSELHVVGQKPGIAFVHDVVIEVRQKCFFGFDPFDIFERFV